MKSNRITMPLLIAATSVVLPATAVNPGDTPTVPPAPTTPSKGTQTSGTIKLDKHIPADPKRPRMPSRQYLLFSYDYNLEECQFSFTDDIGIFSVEIIGTDTGIYYYGEVSYDSPAISLTLPNGHYIINCTSDDNIFYGEGDI